jgi:hypothetical protein
MEEGNITFPLIEKFCSAQINLSPNPVKDKDGKVIHGCCISKFNYTVKFLDSFNKIKDANGRII